MACIYLQLFSHLAPWKDRPNRDDLIHDATPRPILGRGQPTVFFTAYNLGLDERRQRSPEFDTKNTICTRIGQNLGESDILTTSKCQRFWIFVPAKVFGCVGGQDMI